MNKVLKRRVVLIRSMITATDELFSSKQITSEQKVELDVIIKDIRDDTKKHFLSMSVDDLSNAVCYVSYCRSKEQRYDIPKRIMTSVGRYFSRTYGSTFVTINDSVIDKFTRRIKINLNKSFTVELSSRLKFFKGKEIREFYKAAASHSCMTGKCNSFKLNLYELNPDKVSLVVMDGAVRALLWTLDDGVTKLLDRVYPSGHNVIDVLRMWAESNGYILRHNPDQNLVDQTIALSDSSKRTITLKHSGIFPFMDTWRYGQFIQDNMIVMSNDLEFGNLRFSTDQGAYVEIMKCSQCGAKQSRAHETIINGNLETTHLCDSCYSKMIFTCSTCSAKVSLSKLGIDGAKNSYKRSFCKKCTNNMQKFLQYSDCGCGTCEETKNYYVKLFKEAKIDIHKDVMSFSNE